MPDYPVSEERHVVWSEEERRAQREVAWRAEQREQKRKHDERRGREAETLAGWQRAHDQGWDP